MTSGFGPHHHRGGRGRRLQSPSWSGLARSLRLTLPAGAALFGSVFFVGAVPAGAATVEAQVRLPASAYLVPHGAKVEGQVQSGASLDGEVSLAPADPAALTDYADAVSTPGNAQFHQYLSPDSFAQRFGADSSTLNATAAWLSSSGFSGVSIDPDHLFSAFPSGTAGAVSATLRAFGGQRAVVRWVKGHASQ